MCTFSIQPNLRPGPVCSSCVTAVFASSFRPCTRIASWPRSATTRSRSARAHRRQRRPLMISLKRTTVRVSKPSCPPTRKIPLRKQRM